MRRILLLGGKGGVGKTTVASATALASAGEGMATLLVSSDPAHSIGDVFGVRLGDEPTAVAGQLDAVEIDAEATASAHVDAVADRVAASFDPELLPAVRRHLDLARSAPGTLEAALFDRLTVLLEQCPGRYDRLVVDTAPTGHTLRLLALPALLSAWVEGLARQREKVGGMDRILRNMVGDDPPSADPVLTALHERRTRFERAAARLRSDAAVWLVLVPERLAIEETVRAERALTGNGLLVSRLVLNRLLPEEADGQFLAARRTQQRCYVDEIAARLPDCPRVHVAQRPRDVAGVDDLLSIADELAAQGIDVAV